MLTDVGQVEEVVPRDRDGSFDPKIVKKRQKRLADVDEMVISLASKGLTTREVQVALHRLEALVRNRLKRRQYRPETRRLHNRHRPRLRQPDLTLRAEVSSASV
nr:transposase [Streptomyces sp. KS_5]